MGNKALDQLEILGYQVDELERITPEGPLGDQQRLMVLMLKAIMESGRNAAAKPENVELVTMMTLVTELVLQVQKPARVKTLTPREQMEEAYLSARDTLDKQQGR